MKLDPGRTTTFPHLATIAYSKLRVAGLSGPPHYEEWKWSASDVANDQDEAEEDDEEEEDGVGKCFESFKNGCEECSDSSEQFDYEGGPGMSSAEKWYWAEDVEGALKKLRAWLLKKGDAP